MAKEKMEIKFEKPPVHVTANDSLSILVDDIFHSQVGQDVILRMATITPKTEELNLTEEAAIIPQPAKKETSR